ncbi:MAG TPA: glutamate 5-kinase [Methylomirabilota bacterium]|jgi:glutamate 5-kinase|nr:glutamate 5-kinase [Methylomirabilota bacterium]
MAARRQLGRVRRLVVKVGTGLITQPQLGPDSDRIAALAGEIAGVREGREIVLVSSGAIATGMARLTLGERPRSIPEKQAAAAVGQSALMWHYEHAFKRHGIPVGQVLLTAQDIADRARYLNARNTLLALLAFGVLPVVNENDTVAVEEIKVGDNDNLSALVASLIEADLLVILTDVDGLYTSDPGRDPAATKIDAVDTITPEIERLVWRGAGVGSVGGMATKLQAAQKAAAAGVPMVIASGRKQGVLARILKGEPAGTYFAPKADRLGARKRWIAFAAAPQGRLTVDAGAVEALTRRGKSLLPSGVVKVDGEFAVGELVGLVGDGDGREFARGLVNFDADELRKIQGAKTREIPQRLGYKSFDEVIHRDNLVVL